MSGTTSQFMSNFAFNTVVQWLTQKLETRRRNKEGGFCGKMDEDLII